MGAAQHAAIGAVAGGATAASAFVLGGHGDPGLVAAAGVLTAVITVAGREWFWLRAQDRPFREMRWILQRTGSIADTERLMALLQARHEKLLEGRGAGGSTQPALAEAPDMKEGRKRAVPAK